MFQTVGDVLRAVENIGLHFSNTSQRFVYVTHIETVIVEIHSVVVLLTLRRSERQTAIIHKIESVITGRAVGDFVEINNIGVIVVATDIQLGVGQGFTRSCDVMCVPAVVLAENLNGQKSLLLFIVGTSVDGHNVFQSRRFLVVVLAR